MKNYEQIIETLLACDSEKLNNLIKAALEQGASADDILNKGLIAGMDIVGEKMESGEMFIPEVLMTAHVMAGSVEILKPLLGDEEGSKRATVLIGTVKGDLHDIGKNLVAMMMESAGMTVHNIGVDIDPDEFVAQIKEKEVQIVCLSALLTTTMPMMKQTIDTIAEAGIRDQVKIMVGGAPVNQNFADEIGADGYAPDAGSASRLAKLLTA